MREAVSPHLTSTACRHASSPGFSGQTPPEEKISTRSGRADNLMNKRKSQRERNMLRTVEKLNENDNQFVIHKKRAFSGHFSAQMRYLELTACQTGWIKRWLIYSLKFNSSQYHWNSSVEQKGFLTCSLPRLRSAKVYFFAASEVA